MTKFDAINESASPEEVILDELLGADGETPVAQWKITQGAHGPLATYVELTPEADQILRPTEWEHHPRGQAFMAHRTAAIDARNFSRHRKLGGYARKLGFSYGEYPHTNVFRLATLPVATSINEVLDSMPRMTGRMRFYQPQGKEGKASGLEYLEQLAMGHAPVASPEHINNGYYFHDIRGHAVGFTLLNAELVELISQRAEAILDEGVETFDNGTLIPRTAAAGFAGVIDQLSSTLTLPLIFNWERVGYKYLLELASDCGTLILKRESTHTTTSDKALITSSVGLAMAVALYRGRSKEYRVR